MIRTECMICTKKRDDSKILRLRQILNLLTPLPSDGKLLGLAWGGEKRCPYGMYCNDLQIAEATAKRLERQIEGKLEGLFSPKNNKLYHELLNMLGGYFPAVYQYVERQWNMTVKHR